MRRWPAAQGPTVTLAQHQIADRESGASFRLQLVLQFHQPFFGAAGRVVRSFPRPAFLSVKPLVLSAVVVGIVGMSRRHAHPFNVGEFGFEFGDSSNGGMFVRLQVVGADPLEALVSLALLLQKLRNLAQFFFELFARFFLIPFLQQ